MTDVHITREEHGRHGRYVATVAGIEAEAELVFTHRGPGLISADHTQEQRGRRKLSTSYLTFFVPEKRRKLRGLYLTPSVPAFEESP